MLSGETSCHHLAWQRRDYRTPLEKQYRNHRGMLIPDVPNPEHRDLHANIPPPPKPNRELMAGAIVRLSTTDLILPLDGLFAVTEYMFERDTRLSCKIGEHLLKQAGYLEVVC
jgi:hypothetical protein